MNINDWLEPSEYPLQKGMQKEAVISIFMNKYKANGMDIDRLKNVDVWYSNDRQRYLLKAEYNGKAQIHRDT